MYRVCYTRKIKKLELLQILEETTQVSTYPSDGKQGAERARNGIHVHDMTLG